MAPHNSEFKKTEKKEFDEKRFLRFLKEINRSFDSKYSSLRDYSDEELHQLIKSPLSLKYTESSTQEERVAEFNQEYFDVYKGLDGMVLLRQLVSCDRESLNMFTDEELEKSTISLMDLEKSGYDLENPDTCLMFIDLEKNREILSLCNDFVDDKRYYMLLEAGWDKEEEEYENLNEFFGLD